MGDLIAIVFAGVLTSCITAIATGFLTSWLTGHKNAIHLCYIKKELSEIKDQLKEFTNRVHALEKNL